MIGKEVRCNLLQKEEKDGEQVRSYERWMWPTRRLKEESGEDAGAIHGPN